MADHSSTRELSASIERTLRTEARRNELLVAGARAVATLLITLMDTLSVVLPPSTLGAKPAEFWMPLVSGSTAVVSLAVLGLLWRGVYWNGMRYGIPLMDAAIIIAGFTSGRHALGDERFLSIGGLGAIALACTLLAASGGLRLSRAASVFTIGLAVLTYLFLAVPLQALSPNLGIQIALLASAGMLSVWMTAIVRRAVTSEVGRAMLTRFLPRRVIEDAHTDPVALLTQPRSADATVLVTDLRGFTALSERLTPAEVLEFLNEIQGALAAVVREFGGTVDKFMGDGMLAVFGLPEPLDGHAHRAIAASWALLYTVDRMNAQRQRQGKVPVRIGIGLHSGPVVSGCLGRGLRLEFTVLGDTVNVAARLESLTKEHGVTALISGDTVQRAAQSARVADPGAADALLPDEYVSLAGYPKLEPAVRLQSLGELALRGRKDALAGFTFAEPPLSQTRVMTQAELK